MKRLLELEQRLEAVSELAVRIASGDLRTRLAVSPVGDAVDAVVTALNMLADDLEHEKSSRRKAEGLLQDELDAYENAPALFCSLDANTWNVEKCNQTLADALGLKKDQILGRPVLNLLAAEQQAPTAQLFEELPLGVALDRGDCRLQRVALEPIVVSTSLTRVRQPDGRERIRVIWRDVTKERQLEAQLLESQKLESLGRLAGGVAHDFNNILAVIAGANSLLGDLLAQHALDAEDITLIGDAVARGTALTSDLLAFSRQKVVTLAATDVASVIDEATRMVRRLVGPTISIEVQLPAAPLVALIDASQLSQVLINLCVNARDAMPNGGTLRVSATAVALGTGRGNERLGLPDGGYACIAVSDAGTGMAPDVAARAFEPFFTTKPVGQGSGLGLSMCYGIIQQANGRVMIDTHVGLGTTINIYLPLTGSTPQPRQAAAVELSTRGRERLLLVEDDLAVARVTRRILERAGYDVLYAENGHRALELALGPDANVALVVTDVAMPGMGGQELGAELRRKQPDRKILYLSGYPPSAMLSGTALEPGTGFLAKPFVGSTLVQEVRRLLEI